MAKAKLDWSTGIKVNVNFADKELAALWAKRVEAGKAFGAANEAFQAAFIAKGRKLPVSHQLHLNADEKFVFGARFGQLKVIAVPVDTATKQADDAVDF